MYAYFVSGTRLRTQYVRQTILGMPLLRVALPSRFSERSERQMANKLHRLGVHRCLSLPPSLHAALLPPSTETRPLWKLHATDAALALLELQQRSPQCSIIELVDSQFSPFMQQLALELLPRVGHLSFSAPIPDSFAWLLQHDYGVAPLSCPGHVSLCLSPAQRSCALPLWMKTPVIPGLTLTLEHFPLPDGCPALPLFSALAQQGRIDPRQLQICAIST